MQHRAAAAVLPLIPRAAPFEMALTLLTGATGFVGRNLLLRLLAEGQEVAAPVRSREKLLSQLRLEGFSAIPPGLRVLPPDPACWPQGEFDRAILSAGVLFARSKQEYQATNVDWTLDCLRRLPPACRTVVLSSQAAGGPTPAGREARSSADAAAPITWYGASKLALEQAVRAEFPGRPITLLRPPMILGARDTATLPLFRMARGLIRPKPGLRAKYYSFVAVNDLVEAVLVSLTLDPPPQALYPTSAQTITDWQLIVTAAAVCQGRGVTLPIPQIFVKILSRIIDAVPSLRAQTPSLTRDRARDIWAARWVVDGREFSEHTGWHATTGLHETLQSAWDFYRREGSL